MRYWSLILNTFHSHYNVRNEEEEKISHRQLSAWEVVGFGTLNRRGSTPVELVYEPDQPDGRLTFNSQRLQLAG